MLVNISYVRRLSISVIVTGQVVHVLTHVHITCRLANGYTDIQTDEPITKWLKNKVVFHYDS